MSDINTIKENARTFEGLIPPNSAKLVYKEKKAGDTYFYFMDDDGNYYLIPNYIYGYAHCENGKITELIKNPAYGKEIEIALENRFYDDSALEIDEEVTFSK